MYPAPRIQKVSTGSSCTVCGSPARLKVSAAPWLRRNPGAQSTWCRAPACAIGSAV
jgi:hypothetical protein